MDQISYSELRKQLASVINHIEQDKTVYRITRRNHENMVMMREEDFSALNETLYVLSSKANIEHITTSLKQAENHQFVDVDL